MKGILNGQSAKFIVALLTTAVTLLSHYSDKWWEAPVVALLGAAAVYLVPNSNAPAGKGGPPQGM